MLWYTTAYRNITLLKSEQDHRQYRLISLENGLRILLIADEFTSKCAVSATLAAGHFQDPQDCQGLAHLLEHSLFLGNHKYPQANSLSQWVEKHGGHINAWTGTEYSNFYFDCDTAGLEQALDDFAHMLHSPLFEQDKIEKEIMAIDAEFKLKQKDDLRRLYQVHKETCNPKHPFHKFSVGNQQIFQQHSIEELAAMLKAFHQTYYTAHQCKICLVSPLPLEQQQALVERHFAPLSAAKQTPEINYPALYLPEQLGIEINIQPLKAARRMIISFALPNLQQHYRAKPTSLISQLLGDEGEGSLLWYYKEQGWATSLTSGGGIQGSNFKDFNISLQLTEAGLQNRERILNALFHYIRLIEQQGTQEWRFKEKQTLNQLAFNFHDTPKAIDLACHFTSLMFLYPDEHLLSAEFILDQYLPQLQHQVLALMTPSNMRLKLIAPNLETDQQANWYQTPYKVSKLSPSLYQQLQQPEPVTVLTLPKPNPYLIERIHRGETNPQLKHPQKQWDEPGYRFWFGQDQHFNMPKGDLYLSFDCGHVLDGIEAVTRKRLWVALLQEKFNQEYYQATTAGLHFHLYPHQGGFSLHTSGFAQKQLQLAQDLIEKLYTQQDLCAQFSQIKERQLLGLKNTLLNKPINRLFTKLSVLMQKTSYAPIDMAPVLEHTQLDDVIDTGEKLLQRNYIEAMLYGDWQAQEADRFRQQISVLTQRPAQATREISRDILDLRNNHCHILQVSSQHEDTAVVIYFQAPAPSILDAALTIMLEQMWSGSFFHQLRTEKQLGYLVGTGYFPFNQHPGMAFYIQSPLLSAAELTNEIHDFIRDAIDKLTYHPQEEWQRIKQGVIKQLLDKDSSLSMKSQRYWLAIGNKDNHFEQHKLLAKCIQELELDAIKQFAQALYLREGFGEIILYCAGNKNANLPQQGIEIDDINQFKVGASYIK